MRQSIEADPRCMAEGEDFSCGAKAVSFTVLGRDILLCWCEEHSRRDFIEGEHSVDEQEWLAMAAMQSVHGS